HVIDLHPLLLGDGSVPVAPDLVATMRRSGEEILAQARQAAQEGGVQAEFGSIEALGTRVSDAIIEEARRSQADLIVLGTHGRRGVRRLLLGSDAEAIVRHAPVAVLLVRAPEDAAGQGK
ncbi:MAG: universal stress protein, partial [Burkholderiaceae bacterium]|nr:universal stress protein [Burkholderiaceae bacterium]